MAMVSIQKGKLMMLHIIARAIFGSLGLKMPSYKLMKKKRKLNSTETRSWIKKTASTATYGIASLTVVNRYFFPASVKLTYAHPNKTKEQVP
jgi:hypothetical protein